MIRHWLLGLLLAAACLAVLTLPPRREGLLDFTTGSWWRDEYGRWPYPADGEPRDADRIRLQRLQRVLQRTEAQLGRIMLQDSVRRLIARGGWAPTTGTILVTEATVPRAASERARLALRQAEAELGRLSMQSGIRILLLLRTDANVQPNWNSTYLLQPAALEGKTCAVVLTLSPTMQVPELTLLTRVLGPCVYQAAFGMPGVPLQQWLAARGFAPVADWSWSQPGFPAGRTAPLDLSWWRSPYLQIATGDEDGWSGWNWSVPEVACRLGDLDACTRHLAPPDWSFPQGEAAGVFNLSGASYFWRWREDWDLFAGDLLREVGPEKFGEFWRSSAPLDFSFVTATGGSLATWDRRWLVARRGPTLSGPVVRPATTIIWLLLSAGAVSGAVVSARRRAAG